MSEVGESVAPAVTQADIEAYIAAEVAKAVAAANAPVPVKELTREEKLRQIVSRAIAGDGRDSHAVAEAILALLDYVTEGK